MWTISKRSLTQPARRPLGVTIIAILAIIAGILLIFGGLSFLIFGALFTAVTVEDLQQQFQLQNAANMQSLIQFFGSVGIVIGAIVLAVGAGYLVVSYGLLKGKGWARIVAVIVTVVAIVIQVISVISSSMLSQSLTGDLDALASGMTAHMIGIAINGVILYYLYRPNVKAYFVTSRV